MRFASSRAQRDGGIDANWTRNAATRGQYNFYPDSRDQSFLPEGPVGAPGINGNGRNGLSVMTFSNFLNCFSNVYCNFLNVSIERLLKSACPAPLER